MIDAGKTKRGRLGGDVGSLQTAANAEKRRGGTSAKKEIKAEGDCETTKQ